MEERYIIEPQGYRISYLFRKILVPIDGSATSLRALEIAIDFARRYGSKIVVLHVRESDSTDNIWKIVDEKAQEKNIKIEKKEKPYSPHVSSVSNEIINEIVEGGYDLVILGARGNTANEEILLGSTALAVAVNSAISVMIIR